VARAELNIARLVASLLVFQLEGISGPLHIVRLLGATEDTSMLVRQCVLHDDVEQILQVREVFAVQPFRLPHDRHVLLLPFLPLLPIYGAPADKVKPRSDHEARPARLVYFYAVQWMPETFAVFVPAWRSPCR
jgi:hypothetical protein